MSPDTDQSVRMFLASQGGGRKGDLSRFIEEAVRTYIFERAIGSIMLDALPPLPDGIEVNNPNDAFLCIVTPATFCAKAL